MEIWNGDPRRKGYLRLRYQDRIPVTSLSRSSPRNPSWTASEGFSSFTLLRIVRSIEFALYLWTNPFRTILQATLARCRIGPQPQRNQERRRHVD